MANIANRFTHVMGVGACSICRHIATSVETGKAHFSDHAMVLKFAELNGFATKDAGEARRISKKILLDHWYSQHPLPSLYKAEQQLEYAQKTWAEFEERLSQADKRRNPGDAFCRWQNTYDALLTNAPRFQRKLDEAKKALATIRAKREEAPKAPHGLMELFGIEAKDLKPVRIEAPRPQRQEWKPSCTKEDLVVQYSGERPELIDLLWYLRSLRPPKAKLRKKFVSKAQKRNASYEDKEALYRSYQQSRIEHQQRVFGDKFSLAKAAASTGISVDW